MSGMRTGEPVTNELADLVGPFWSEAKVRDVLGIDSEVLAGRRDERTVLGLTPSDGDPFYPVSQFHRHDGVVEVKPAFIPFMTTLRGFDPWTVAVLLNTQAPELNEQTPLDWVRHGGSSDALVDLAHAVAREWAAGSAAPRV